MSDDDQNHPDGDDQEKSAWSDSDVGYGRPPKATQFKPGQSGNPKGRPPGAKTRRFGSGGFLLHDALTAEIVRQVPVRDLGKSATMSQLQAIVRRLAILAMQGDVKAAELFLRYTTQVQRHEQRLNERLMDAMATYKVTAAAEVKRREARGIMDMSDILPHPDHVEVDMTTGEVVIRGPMSPPEAEAVALASEELPKIKQALEEMDRMQAGRLAPERRSLLIATRQELEQQARSYADILGEPYP